MSVKNVLIVESSDSLSEMLMQIARDVYRFNPIICNRYQEVIDILDVEPGKIHAAITCTILPDAKDGEILDLLTSLKIPIVVFTSKIHEKADHKLRNGEILAIIKKEDEASAVQIFEALQTHIVRLYK